MRFLVSIQDINESAKGVAGSFISQIFPVQIRAVANKEIYKVSDLSGRYFWDRFCD